MRPVRKRPRLGRKTYRGRGWFFVTACCEGRRPVFADPHFALRLIDRLRSLASVHGFHVHAFCVMPDHVHLLVEGAEDASDLLVFMARFKHQTAHESRRGLGGRLWQRSFYDHVLRPDESPSGVAWYIWLNPVRKGLCRAPEDYPFSGSFTVDWKRSSRPPKPWEPPWKSARLAPW
jgi:REP-associated tyrosine transposase